MSLFEPNSFLLLTLRVLLCTSTAMTVFFMLSAFRRMDPLHRILFKRRMIWVGGAVMSLGCLVSLWSLINVLNRPISWSQIELVFFPLFAGLCSFVGCLCSTMGHKKAVG